MTPNDTRDLTAGRHYPGITRVAAAVLIRPAADMGAVGGHEFLLAQRPPGKAYAGFWEFPGGKVEDGEMPVDACIRELSEELGIRCQTVTPWVSREFVYPHAHVRIRFFRITRWQGAITPLEHSGFAWVRCGSDPDVAPILPANGPILRALSLPPVYAISCAEEHGVEAELERVAAALRAGVRLFQLRDKSLDPDRRAHLGAAMLRLCRTTEARVLVNDDPDLARELGADGLHLSAAGLRAALAAGGRPDFEWVAASCHDAAELADAVRLGADFAVLGPVLPTATHPGDETHGWRGLATLLDDCSLPVYALGGMRAGMTDIAADHGAHGVAVMRHWPQAPESDSAPPCLPEAPASLRG